MKFNEIVDAPSRDEYMDTFKRHFIHSEIVAQHNGKDVRRYDDGISIYLGVFDQEQLIAYLSVIVYDHHYQIGQTSVDKNFRQRGWMRCLLDYFVHNIGPLRSDMQQTIEAQDMWKAMIRMPGNAVISYFDVRTGEKTRMHADGDKIIPDPWKTQNENIFIEIEKRPLSEHEILHRKLSERIIEWYGVPGSFDGRLINP